MKPADPVEIALRAEASVLMRLSEYQEASNKRIAELIRKLESERLSTTELFMMHRIDKTSVELNNVLDGVFLAPYSGQPVIMRTPNGDTEGSLMVPQRREPRLSDAYLRISCPRISDMHYDDVGHQFSSGLAIVVVPGGGVHLVDSETPWRIAPQVREGFTSVLFLSKDSKESFPSISERTIASWMKSSLCLWYCDSVLGTVDISPMETLRKIPVPVSLATVAKEIDSLVDQILALEGAFLREVNDSTPMPDPDETAEGEPPDSRKDSYSITVEAHNAAVLPLARQIDDIINQTLMVDQEELDVIQTLLERKGIFSIQEPLTQAEGAKSEGSSGLSPDKALS